MIAIAYDNIEGVQSLENQDERDDNDEIEALPAVKEYQAQDYVSWILKITLQPSKKMTWLQVVHIFWAFIWVNIIFFPIKKSDEDKQDDLKTSKVILIKVRVYFESEDIYKNKTLDEILAYLKTYRAKYEKALQLSDMGKQVALKK